MKCLKCKGFGKFLPPEGITKADFKDCAVCGGSGERPEWHVSKKQKKQTKRVYFHKLDGMEDLKDLD